MKEAPVGVFDSGVGGLSVYRWIKELLPHERVIYLADTARLPYGLKPQAVVREFVIQIVGFLVDLGAKAVVIACNTATAAGLEAASGRFSIPLVGMIGPGAREAVRATRNRRVGLLATEGTVRSGAYQRAIRQLDPEVEVFARGCTPFTTLVEEGRTEGPEAEEVVREQLAWFADKDIDTAILGCTHYAFLRSVISRVLGPSVTLVDPGRAVAEELAQLLRSQDLLNRGCETAPEDAFYTSGSPRRLQEMVQLLLGLPAPSVGQVSWPG